MLGRLAFQPSNFPCQVSHLMNPSVIKGATGSSLSSLLLGLHSAIRSLRSVRDCYDRGAHSGVQLAILSPPAQRWSGPESHIAPTVRTNRRPDQGKPKSRTGKRKRLAYAQQQDSSGPEPTRRPRGRPPRNKRGRGQEPQRSEPVEQKGLFAIERGARETLM